MDEIDDPLYGTTDAAGAESVAAVSAAAEVISKCCEARQLAAAHGPVQDDADGLLRTPAFAGACR